MTVYFIGAGPGDPELLTLKAQRLIKQAPLIIYTGSLVPLELIQSVKKPDANILDSAGMTLDQIMNAIQDAHQRGWDVARVHTGDPLIYGSTAEQMRRLQAASIPYEVIPGVSSFSAAAAALKQELTLPEVSQTIIISRVEGRTPMPDKESLEELAKHEATLCLFLSITLLTKLLRKLRPILGETCPIAVVYKASCAEQKILKGTLATIARQVREAKVSSQSIIFVGKVLDHQDFAESRLYAADFQHGFRRLASDAGANS